jgi:4-hydroxy-4-methyl-2-oxoglutarate aldolase
MASALKDRDQYGEIWDVLGSALGADASDGRGVLSPSIRPLTTSWRLVARAHVIQVRRGDNGSVRELLDAGTPGSGAILVVAGAVGSTTSVIGGVTAENLYWAGYAGMVTDGPVRDAAEIRAGGFPVWCTGTTPTASAKNWRAGARDLVVIDGIPVRTGDLVLADEDGVVVWPAEDVPAFVAVAAAKQQSDDTRLARIREVSDRAD